MVTSNSDLVDKTSLKYQCVSMGCEQLRQSSYPETFFSMSLGLDNGQCPVHCLRMLRILSIKESKVYIQRSLSIHQESRDETRQIPPTKLEKKTFLTRITNVHNRGPK